MHWSVDVLRPRVNNRRESIQLQYTRQGQSRESNVTSTRTRADDVYRYQLLIVKRHDLVRAPAIAIATALKLPFSLTTSRMRAVDPAGGCLYHSLESSRRWLPLVTVHASHTKILASHPPYSFSPAVFKAEIKPSGDRTAVRFACGAESLAASAVYSFMVWAVRRRQDFHCHIIYTSDYVNLLACWSRYFPESVPDRTIGVGYSLFYYMYLLLLRHTLSHSPHVDLSLPQRCCIELSFSSASTNLW